MHVDHSRGLGFGERQRLGLLVVVAKHSLGNGGGHLGEQVVALLDGQVARGHDAVEQDLDVHLVIGAVDSARVVDGVRVDLAAAQRELDTRGLGQAEVAALADHATAQLRSVDSHGIVGLVAGVGLGLRARLHVRPDAAVPEQVHRRAQDRPDQLVGWESLVVDVECRAGLLRQRDRLGAAGEHPAPGRDQIGVVVLPGGTRQAEQPLALVEAGRRVGVRIEEHVAMVEGAHQPDVP